MRKWTLWFMVWYSAIFGSVKFVEAQDGLFEPVYKGLSIDFFEWSIDSQTVRFKDYYELDGTSQWLLYTPSIQMTEIFDIATYPSIRSSLEAHSTAPLPTFEDSISLIYPSPNNQFAVYAADQGDREYYRLAITDITTGQAIIIDSIQPRFASDPTYFYIRWSENSKVFFVEITRDVLIYYYYIDVSHGLNNVKVTSLYGENSDFHIETGGRISKVYDIDTTGRFLLIQGRGITPKTDSSGLIVLDMIDFSSIEVAAIRRSFASFNRTDDNKINYVTKDGIYEYDRQTQVSRLRNPTITTYWATPIVFSPDGRYMASTGGSHTQYLYVLEIESTSRPTATP